MSIISVMRLDRSTHCQDMAKRATPPITSPKTIYEVYNMQILDKEKRWLEIIFYLICNKIFSINNDIQDILDFIKGYQWTNMFEYDILISTITKQKILLDTNFIPTKYEFLVNILYQNKWLRVKPEILKELTKDTPLQHTRYQIFHAQMKEEITPTEIHPKLHSPKIHETIYSFLLALNYMSNIVKNIKL